jgi:hypothetical protein
MRFAAILLDLCGLILVACSREPAVRVLSPEQLDSLVGRRVELVGIVTNAAAPQILGIDLWGMEKLAGQRVRVYGVLQRTVITRTGPDTSRAVDSAPDDPMPLVFREPGKYYRLQRLTY